MGESALEHHLDAALGGHWTVRPLRASSFCETWRAEDGRERLFVKTLRPGEPDVLDAEVDGLRALAEAAAIRVPAVVALGERWLALEWLDLRAGDDGFGQRLGEALAALHDAPCPLSPPRYGWPRDNFLGATPQVNELDDDWIAFLASERLGAMRKRLARHRPGHELLEAVDRVIERLPTYFEGYQPRPSLIHGDLWSGNWGMLPDGTPVIFDPAVSCSDAEAELAMMELFGGPPAGFWPAYRQYARVDEDYARRRPVYQLYHLLNHALLFGGGYRQQALECAWACLRGG